MPTQLDIRDPDFENAFAALLAAKRESAPDVDDAVAAILADVKARGDGAVIDHTRRFDNLALTPETMAIPASEIERAANSCDAEAIAALELAAARIEAFHARQIARGSGLHGRGRTETRVSMDTNCRRRPLCARWHSRLSIVGPHERGARQGRRSRTAGYGGAGPRRRSQPAGSGRRPDLPGVG